MGPPYKKSHLFHGRVGLGLVTGGGGMGGEAYYLLVLGMGRGGSPGLYQEHLLLEGRSKMKR